MSTQIIRISNFNQISRQSRRLVYFIDSGSDAFGSVRFKSRDIPAEFTRENLEIYPEIFLPFLAVDSNNNVVILIDMDQLVNFDPVMYSDIKHKALSRAQEGTSNTGQEPENSGFLVHRDTNPGEAWTMGLDAISQARRRILGSTISDLQNKINDMTRKVGEYTADLIPMHENLSQIARPEYFIHQNNSSCWLKFKFQMSQFEAGSEVYNLRPDGSSVEFTIHMNYRMHCRNNQFSISDVTIAAHSSNRILRGENHSIVSHPIISAEENRDSPRILSQVCVGDALDSVIKALSCNDFDSVYALIKQAFTVVEGPYVSPSNFFPVRG